jgi:hypothetical protein
VCLFLFGLPTGGMRLAIPQEDKALLVPLVSIIIPRKMIGQKDGMDHNYLSFKGRMGSDIIGLQDLIVKRDEGLSDGI